MGALLQLQDSNKKEVNLPDEFQRQFNRSICTIKPLQTDVDFAIQQWQADRKSQFWSRTSIRCLCAAIEATLFLFRRMAEKLGTLHCVKWNESEIEILTEQKTIKGMDGVTKKKPAWLPFRDSVKETFRLLAKSIGATIEIDYQVPGFSGICKTFENRNRLMHPKQPDDIQISAKDIDNANQGINWFNETYAGVLRQCLEHLKNVNASRNK